MTQSANNLSRTLFKQFLSANPDAVRVDSRNVFDVDNKRYAFSLTSSDKIIARQFYQDCDAVVCLNNITKLMHVAEKINLVIDSAPNRITTKGIKAYSAKSEITFPSTTLFNTL